MADIVTLIVYGFFVVSFLFIAIVWFIWMFPKRLLGAFIPRKKEWWQDRRKRYEAEAAKERAKQVAKKKAKKGK